MDNEVKIIFGTGNKRMNFARLNYHYFLWLGVILSAQRLLQLVRAKPTAVSAPLPSLTPSLKRQMSPVLALSWKLC